MNVIDECFSLEFMQYGSRYLVTNTGEVYSEPYSYEVRNQHGATGKFINRGQILLKGAINNTGYKQIKIDGRYECVHKIVAKLFLENPYNFTEVNHKNGNKLDNTVNNLEWCSRAYNVQHSYQMGLNKGATGTSNGRNILREVDVINIVEMYSFCNVTQKTIAAYYKVAQITISNILTGKSWSWLTGIEK